MSAAVRAMMNLERLSKSNKWRGLVKTIIAIVGIFGSLVTIYTFFFYENKNELQYEIIADASVLDIKADLGNLDIFYGKSNLKENKENLRIISVRIINVGSTNILKDSYDDEDPLGLRITGGSIIERPELLECSNDYLRKNLKLNFWIH